MRIAHTHSGIRGIASYCLNIYNYFKNVEDTETLIISEAKWTKQRIPVLEPKSSLYFGVLPWAHHISEIEEKLAEWNPDILHHHHPCGRIDFAIPKLLKSANAPLLVTVHMSVGSKKYFIDRVMHIFYMLSRKNFLNTTAYIAISKYVKKQLEEISGVPKERIVQIYAGVNTDVFKPIPYTPHKRLEILFVGQITPEKGVDILIDVVIELAKERDVRLSIVGNGTHMKRWMRQTRNNPEINWVGFVSGQQEVAKYYANSDIVVLPTRWEEAFSYIPLESLASGTAIAASRVGGNMEAIQDGVSGFLFKQGNGKELYEILKKVEIEPLWEMGLKGREYILKNHTLKLFGEKYHSLYDNVLKDPSHLKQID